MVAELHPEFNQTLLTPGKIVTWHYKNFFHKMFAPNWKYFKVKIYKKNIIITDWPNSEFAKKLMEFQTHPFLSQFYDEI